jgi:phage I-like protein
MKDLLKALGLPDAASETEAIAAVAALQAQAADHATQIATHLAALKAEPDPAQFAPAATVLALQGQVAALTRQIAAREVDALIEAGIADGRILPDLEPWARTLNALALKGFLDKAKPIAALGGMQTAGHAIGGGAAQSSSEAEVAVMKALGLTAAQFAAGKIKQEG